MNVRFVTGNVGKAAEAAAVLAPLGIHVEPVAASVHEIQADTLEEVARAKADALRGHVAPPFFVEDAGLFVDALEGFPGVYSAYAFKTLGNAGILRLLSSTRRRRASFRAVVAYVDGPGKPRLFSGECHGSIATAAVGSQGFGFDPVFRPLGARRTFAQFTAAEKNAVSHRGEAMRRFATHLSTARSGLVGRRRQPLR